MSTDTLPTDTVERRRTGDLINTELRSGDFTSIYPNTMSSEPEVGFVFFGNRDTLDAATNKLGDGLYETPGLGVTIVDLNKCPANASGQREYNGLLFHPDVQALVVDKGQLDWHKGVGYQGIRKGEFVSLGRENARFPNAVTTTSRKHSGITVDEETGLITVVDGKSLNGTTVLVGNLDAQTSGVEMGQTVRDTGPTYIDEKWDTEVIRTAEQEAVFLNDAVIKGRVEQMRNSQNQYETTKTLMNYEAFEPKVGFSLSDKEFMFSDIFSAGKRLHCVIYENTKGDQKVRPTLYYKSQSDGGWRATPGFYDDERYSKGDIDIKDADGKSIEYGQYTQGTKPTEYAAALLEEMETNSQTKPRTSVALEGFVKDIFRLSRLNEDGIDTSLSKQTKVTVIYDEGMNGYSPGAGFTTSPEASRSELQNMKLPKGFEPDFAKDPVKAYAMKHTMLGRCDVTVYQSTLPDGRPAEWHVARDPKTDTVWLDRIVDASPDAGVTALGTYKNVVVAGALSAKPMDYGGQLAGMEAGKDFTIIDGTSYASLKPLLDTMPWVKHYRDTRLRQVAATN